MLPVRIQSQFPELEWQEEQAVPSDQAEQAKIRQDNTEALPLLSTPAEEKILSAWTQMPEELSAKKGAGDSNSAKATRPASRQTNDQHTAQTTGQRHGVATGPSGSNTLKQDAASLRANPSETELTTSTGTGSNTSATALESATEFATDLNPWWWLLALIPICFFLMLFKKFTGSSQADTLEQYQHSGPKIDDKSDPNVRGQFKKVNRANTDSGNDSGNQTENNASEFLSVEQTAGGPAETWRHSTLSDGNPGTSDMEEDDFDFMDAPDDDLVTTVDVSATHVPNVATDDDETGSLSDESERKNMDHDSDEEFSFDDSSGDISDLDFQSEATTPSENGETFEPAAEFVETATDDKTPLRNDSFDLVQPETPQSDRSDTDSVADDSNTDFSFGDDDDLFADSSPDLIDSLGPKDPSPDAPSTEFDANFKIDASSPEPDANSISVQIEDQEKLSDSSISDSADSSTLAPEAPDDPTTAIAADPMIASVADVSKEAGTVVTTGLAGVVASKFGGMFRSRKSHSVSVAAELPVPTTVAMAGEGELQAAEEVMSEEISSEDSDMDLPTVQPDDGPEDVASKSLEETTVTDDELSDILFDDDSDAGYEFDIDDVADDVADDVESNADTAKEEEDTLDFSGDLASHDSTEPIEHTVPSSLDTADRVANEAPGTELLATADADDADVDVDFSEEPETSLENVTHAPEATVAAASDSAADLSLASSEIADNPSIVQLEQAAMKIQPASSEDPIQQLDQPIAHQQHASSPATELADDEFKPYVAASAHNELPLLEDKFLDDIVSSNAESTVEDQQDDSADIAFAEQQRQELQSQIAQLESTNSSLLSDLTQAQQVQQSHESALEAQEIAADKSIAQLQTEFSDANEKIETLTADNKDLTDRATQLDASLDQQSTEQATEEANSEQLQKQLEKLEDTLSASTDQNTELQSQLAASQEAMAATNTKLEAALAISNADSGVPQGSLSAAAGLVATTAAAAPQQENDPFRLEPEKVKLMLKKLKLERKKRRQTKEHLAIAEKKRREVTANLVGITEELESLKRQMDDENSLGLGSLSDQANLKFADTESKKNGSRRRSETTE